MVYKGKDIYSCALFIIFILAAALSKNLIVVAVFLNKLEKIIGFIKFWNKVTTLNMWDVESPSPVCGARGVDYHAVNAISRESGEVYDRGKGRNQTT